MKTLILVMIFNLFLNPAYAKTSEAVKKGEKRKPNAIEEAGAGPLSISCVDDQGNIQLLNVIEVTYSQKSNYALAAGFGAVPGTERKPIQLKGLCTIRPNPNFAPSLE